MPQKILEQNGQTDKPRIFSTLHIDVYLLYSSEDIYLQGRDVEQKQKTARPVMLIGTLHHL